MEGYTRHTGSAFMVSSALADAMQAHPHERVTQIILNATRLKSTGETLSTSALWNLHDELLIDALEEYADGPEH